MAADGRVEIVNIALSHIGSTKLLEDLDGPAVEARLASLHYRTSVESVLRRADWPFARARAQLSQEGTPPAGWGYSYALPADCVAARYIDVGRGVAVTPAYSIGRSGGQRRLYTDQEGAVLVYTARVVDSSQFSPEFTEALTWRLAAMLARPIQKDQEREIEALKIYEAVLSRAMTDAYNEEDLDPQPDSEHFSARLG